MVSDTIHVEALAFALSEERISNDPTNDLKDQSNYILYYCILGMFFVMLSSLNIFLNYEFVQSIQSMVNDKLSNYSDLVISVIILGFLIIISEFVATCVFMPHNPFPAVHVFLWLSTIMIIMLMVSFLCCYKCIHARRNNEHFKVNFIPMFVVFIIVLFGLHIYIYALPAFLLLLVYPTKVIATTAYMISFVVASSVIGSLFVRICKVFIKRMPTYTGKCTEFNCFHITMTVIIVINFGLMFIMPIIVFGALIQLVYALVLGQASAVTAGPYTIISLIPSIAITLFSWMIKRKLFGGKEAEDEETQVLVGSQKHQSKEKKALLLDTLNDDGDHKTNGSKNSQKYGGTV